METLENLGTKEVVVLAKNFSLTGPQRSLLARGLTFIPTLDLDRGQKPQFLLDLQNYHRRLKLALYFGDEEDDDIQPFVGPSDWTPPMDRLPPEIGRLIDRDLQTFKRHFSTRPEKYNISTQEVRALRQLKAVKHIVLKPADKGSAVVIQSREQYVHEAMRQLEDNNYYKKLDKPIYMETVPMISDILDRLENKKFIIAKQRKYLQGEFQPRERRFYTLPKIHKDPTKWTVPNEIPPGRPIVSDCGSESYRTAEYLEHFLTPLSVKHPAYVRDTYHFVDIVKGIRTASDFCFFTMDVDNLYTNIPIEAGLACVRDIFARYPDPSRPDEELLELLEINLTRNDFIFDGQYYLQVKGTAMGKKFAPAYANIYMANWEQEALSKCQQKPAHYWRYLDDIWGIWTGSREDFGTFLDTLNSHDPSIKLKSVVHAQTIDFLDVTVFKGPKFNQNFQLDLKVHFKDTDTHALLHRHSFHPKHTFKGVVKSQLLRFSRICTREEDFREAGTILFKSLRKRGYGRTFLRRCLRTFREVKVRNRGSLIPLVTTFSTVGRDLNHRLKHNYTNTLGETGLLSGSEVISAFRRNKNLSDFLVQAKLPPLRRDKTQLLESQFEKLRFIKNQKEKTIYKIQQGFSTRSTNCVYIIYCSKCLIQYVGESKNSLSVRMTQHRYNINNGKVVDTPLVQHFLQHGLASMRMAGLQRNLTWTDGERQAVERRWIARLSTKRPFGLNL